MKKIFLIMLLTGLFTSGYAQEAVPAEQASIKVKNIKLSLSEAINMVLKNNLTLKSAAYDLLMSDSDYLKFQKKYSINLSGEAYFQDQTTPSSGIQSSFGGDQSTNFDLMFTVSKLFSTGTLLRGGISNSIYDQNDKAIPGIKPYEDPAFFKPVFFLHVQQSLLKNAFGFNDMRQLRSLKEASEIKKDAYIDQLSVLVVSALVDYWQVIIERGALRNAREEYKSTVEIRDIIARNIKYGLSERFELNQYDSLVAAAKSRLEFAEYSLEEAIRKLLRTINMPPDTKVEGITELSDQPVNAVLEDSIKIAFEKRNDYRNSQKQVELAELNLAIAGNNLLPSIDAYFTLTHMGQSDKFGDAFTNVLAGDYPTWKAGVIVTYPLWDKETKASVRDADYKLKQARIELEKLRQEVRDDVINRHERVLLFYSMLVNNREVLRESELYYSRVRDQARKGKLNSLAVKNALDSLSSARQKVLESLVQYNIAILQYDLAKNEIFEKYNVDIKSLLKEIQQAD